MSKYRVCLGSLVTVHMSRNYTVSAKTREEAMKKAEEKFRTACKNSKRYIDCGDTVVVDFIEEMEDAHGL